MVGVVLSVLIGVGIGFVTVAVGSSVTVGVLSSVVAVCICCYGVDFDGSMVDR